MTTTVNILGTGTPTPTQDRFGTAFAVTVDDAVLMVDCGPGATTKLVKVGLLPTQVDALYLTHHHFDHNVDIPCFLLTRWDQSAGRANQLQVFGPPPTEVFVERLIGTDGAFSPDLTARIGFHTSLNVYRNRGGQPPREWPEVAATDVRPGWVHHAERWTMHAFHAQHAQPYLDCLAYRLETSDGVVAFSGDTEPCDSVRDAARDADVFLCMAWDDQERMVATGEDGGQTGIQGAARLAREAGVRHLVLVHTGPAISSPDERDRTTAVAREIFGGQVTFAEEASTVKVG